MFINFRINTKVIKFNFAIMLKDYKYYLKYL